MKDKIQVLSVILGVIYCGMAFRSEAAQYATSPTADAFVATGPTGNLSNNNYGGGGALALSAAGLPNGEFQTVMRFSLAGIHSSLDTQFGAGQWSIQSVSLTLTASPHNNAIYNDVAAGQFAVSLMQNNSWVEGTGTAGAPTTIGITYNTLQSTFINGALDQPLGTFDFGGGTSGANSYSLTLSSQLTSDILTGSDLTLRLLAADDHVSYLFSSRSATLATSQPQLLITAVPEPQSLALLGFALGGLVCRRRLRRSDKHCRKNRPVKALPVLF